MVREKDSIIHILYSGLGGHASVVFSLIEADTTARFSHVIIFYGIENVPGAYLDKASQLKAEALFVHKKPGLDLGSYKEVQDIIKRIRPKAILLHSVNLILPVWRSAKQSGAKLIAVEHQPNHLKSKKEFVWSVLLMMLAKKVVYLTSLYEHQMKKVLGAFFRSSKVTVINNGINTDLFAPGQNFTTDTGMLARITPTKDHKTLISAWKLLENKVNDSLLIAGDGELKLEMENRVKELNLENVHFKGMLNEQDSLDFLKNLKLYVHASLGETMSTSLMQAMACGKVIVASDVEGISNMISNNENGILVPAENPGALANAIEFGLNNEQLRQTLSANARHTALEKFSNKAMFQKYLSLIEE